MQLDDLINVNSNHRCSTCILSCSKMGHLKMKLAEPVNKHKDGGIALPGFGKLGKLYKHCTNACLAGICNDFKRLGHVWRHQLGDSVKSAFHPSKASWHLSDHSEGMAFFSRLFKGATLLAYPLIKFAEIICETQEISDIMNVLWPGPVCDDFFLAGSVLSPPLPTVCARISAQAC